MRKIIISVDFEKRWGVYHIYGIHHDAYREELENVHLIVPEMIKMFKERSLRVTWATVGAIMLSSWNEYFSRMPNKVNYENKSLQFIETFAEYDLKGELYFAPDLVDLIFNHFKYGQELASHSFSHTYFGENGVTKNDFVNDTKAMKSVLMDKYSIRPHSYVYPRNQVIYTDVLKNNGYKAWRTNKNLWYHNANSNEISISLFAAKSLRMLESINILRQILNTSKKIVSHQVCLSVLTCLNLYGDYIL